MVTARVRNKPAASKVMRREFAKSGNDDLVVVSHTTESSATAVAKKPSSKAVGVGEIEEEEDADVGEDEDALNPFAADVKEANNAKKRPGSVKRKVDSG